MSVKYNAALGNTLVKTAQAVPQNTTGAIFSLAGGAIKVTGLFGIVSTVMSGTATTLSLGYTGTNAGICTATAITSAAVGTLLIPGFPTSAAPQTPVALVVASFYFTTSTDPQFLFAPFVLGYANTAITATTNANNSGKVDWYLSYIPLTAGASVS